MDSEQRGLGFVNWRDRQSKGGSSRWPKRLQTRGSGVSEVEQNCGFDIFGVDPTMDFYLLGIPAYR